MHTSEETAGCFPGVATTLSEKLRTLPFRLALMVTEALTLTAEGAEAVKPALVWPEAMVTDGGTVTLGLLLLRVTLVLLVAAALRLAVQENEPGGVRLAGLHVRFESTGLPGAG